MKKTDSYHKGSLAAPEARRPESGSIDLMTHVRVNQIAAFYVIKKLQTRANENVDLVLRKYPRECMGSNAIIEAFTKSDDKDLQDIFKSYLVSNIDCPANQAVLKQLPDIGDLGLELLHQLSKRIVEMKVATSTPSKSSKKKKLANAVSDDMLPLWIVSAINDSLTMQ